MKNITSSVYSFEKLRNGGYLYVDKTEFIWNLINPAGESYFLSRPRRFGKSLTISTLKAVFEGKKELFKGLAIYDKPYDWKPYPVIHLDMANCDVHTESDLRDYLVRMLQRLARQHGVSVDIQRTQLSSSFSDLIEEIAKTTPAVILLDEYDKPILENITNPDVLVLRDTLADFYSAIKKEMDYERFVFITGVSKFCHVSLFSKLNNLTDITMDARYATMLGYTQAEFESYFEEQIEAEEKKHDLSHKDFLAKIKTWYDGFRFEENSETVYNPVSLANFFEKGGKFSNYWFETGTPSFLLGLIMKSKLNFSVSLNTPVSSSFFNAFEISDLDPLVLLFQTGYLTVDRVVQRQVPFTDKIIMEYYLRFPNREVEESFNNSLLAYCTTVRKQDSQELILNLITAVGSGDADGFMKLFQSIFAGIPYNIHVKDEHYYQTVCYLICDLLKMMVQAETATSSGRIDMMVAAGEWIYVIEFKLNKSADKAMQQIENKDYALKYRKEGKRIMLIGVNFDFNAGNITDWIKEEYLG